MRGRLLAPTMLAVLLAAGVLALVGARAAPNGVRSSCTAAQKAQREAALAAYRKRIGPDRKAYFAKHKNVKLRRAFLQRQRARLMKLEQDAACTVPAGGGGNGNGDAAKLTKLRTYVTAMKAQDDLFDPALTEPADEALATITDDLDNCELDPELADCPVPASEYQDTAKALRDAGAQLKQLATKLAVIVPPPMAVADYDAAATMSAGDCGIDLVTVAAAHKAFHNSASKWATTVGTWADTYAAGKSIDFDMLDFTPGADGVGDETHQALVVWAVMVSGYWNSLAKAPDVTSAPALPAWIGDLRDEDCPEESG